MDKTELVHELKQLIVDECGASVRAQDIADDATLIGSDSDLGLDSLDALQIVVAVKQRYGTRIHGSGAARAALRSVSTLADRILA